MPIQFCHECNNILYPKYENSKYVLACTKCGTSVDMGTNEVFKRVKEDRGESKNMQYFLNDVTLPTLNKICEKCENNKCVCYMRKSDVKALDAHYICTSCMYEWTDTA